MTTSHYDPQIEANTFYEGEVVWDIFLSILTSVTPLHPVVADTPFNHPWNRDMYHQAAAGWLFPVLEVALDGDPDTLLNRARLRAKQSDVHEIKARFSVRPERYGSAYRPVLGENHVLRVDSTDLNAVDPAHLAGQILNRLADAAAGQEEGGFSDSPRR